MKKNEAPQILRPAGPPRRRPGRKSRDLRICK
jgi:hypothetical protein